MSPVHGLQASSEAERAPRARWWSQQESWSARIIPFDAMVREFCMGLDSARSDDHITN